MKILFLSRPLAALALALLAVNAYAYDFSSGMIYYNVLSEEDRTVEVTSPGKGYYYRGSRSIPSKVINNGITYTVTSIGDKAFRYSNELTSVEFPATLVSIGIEAFYGCTQLKTVVLSGTSLASVGDGAFSGCSKLISADLSTASLTAISDKMFYECGSLTDVKFSTSLAAIGTYAFYDCDKLTSVDLSSTSLTSIGVSAFDDCDALTSVDLSSTSLTSIGNEAFENCDVLTSVAFPASLTSIGNYAFYNCDALTSVDLSSTSLTSIGGSAFRYCDALTSVSFPTSLTSIGYYAFSGCEALTNLTVDESNPAFASRDNVLYSKSLDTLVCYPAGLGKEVVIPEMVRSVRYDAFPGEVDTVYCQPQTPPTAVDGYFQNMFSSDELMNAVLYVPVGTKAAYMKVDPWRNFWNVEEMDFATVGIDGVAAQGVPSVTVRGGAIVVEGAAATDVVEVFAADGRCAYRGASATISHLPGGVYVVRVGKHVQKVAL